MSQEFMQLLQDVRGQQTEIRLDSRLVEQGDLFIAVPGVNEDGARFIPMAVERGAAIIVCRAGSPEAGAAAARGCRVVTHEEPREALWRLAQARYRTDETAPRVIGVTGTNGKTTTAYLLEHLFTSLGFRTGVLGTVSYRWPGHEEAAPLTTPDALRVHRMLREMYDAGAQYAIMEVSSHALDQQRVGGVPFVGAIFTNLTQDHLDFHRDMETYFKAKARLFLECPRADKALAINADDPWGRRLLELCPQALSFGLGAGEPGRRHLKGELLSSTTAGTHLRMTLDGREWELRSPLVGEFNAANLMGVQALLMELGFAPSAFACLHDFHGVSGRLERVRNSRGLDVFVDYAHTPDALIKVLKALRGAGFRRIVTVFGCGGNRDRSKRPIMGQAVADYSDVAVLTSDNPRREDPQAIIEDVLPGLAHAAEVHVEADRRRATELALGLLRPGDALLIAGKGHEDYQIIGDVKHPYSDQLTVKELLA
ncbi:MAG: UDP-N-acetylmuramoyl-L-alanyl-D-glutamate--2,6-diaminopimelate ligase [Desulfovibrionaceae bacterium]